MSETRFTPGPWSIAPAPSEADLLEIVSEYSELPAGRKAANWIAECDAGGLDEDLEQNWANAHLIAAAPALYAALDRLTRVFGGVLSPTQMNAMVAAQAALSQARGEG